MQQQKQQKDERKRNWLITWNNYPPHYLQVIDQLKVKCSYMIYCLEEAPTTGTKHIHIYCEFRQPMRFQTLKTICQDFHIDKCDSKQEDIINYVKKHGNYTEFGVKKQQGERTDLKQVIACKDYQEALTTYPEKVIQYGRSVEKYFTDLQRFQLSTDYSRYPKTVFWIYGETGTGKSKLFYDFVKKLKLSKWVNSRDLQWFDGYNGQEAVLFDDFRAGQCRFEFLLNLLDEYPLIVPIKGSFVQWKPKYIFITCPRNYDEEFVKIDRQLGRQLDEKREDLGQLERRLTYIHKAFYFNGVFSRQIMKDTLDRHTGDVLREIFGEQNHIQMNFQEDSEPLMIMPEDEDRMFGTENINPIWGE